MYQLAGSSSSFSAVGYWWACIGERFWPSDEQERKKIDEIWDKQFGDRRQEIVFIGVDLEESSVKRQLNKCLITDKEEKLGVKGWARFTDPLPAFDLKAPPR